MQNQLERRPDHPTGMVVRLRFSTMLWLLAVALVGGVMVGRWLGGTPSAAALAQESDATPISAAESAELEALRTQVAQTPEPAVCTPQPTPTAAAPTPTPTLVPASPSGAPLSYLQGAWTVTVTGASQVAGSDAVTATGMFLQIGLTVVNNTANPESFPFHDLQLVDAQGRTFVLASGAMTTLLGPGWAFRIAPALESEQAAIFDVATDAGSTFTLQSTEDPTFRVAVELVVRG